MDEAADSIIVVDPGTLSYVYMNEAAGRLYGLPRGLMMERGLPWVIEHLGLWNAEILAQRYRALIDQYPKPTTETHEVRRDGLPPLVIESTRRAVQVEGEWMVITVSRDISERRAEQRRLARLQAAIDETGNAILVIDPQAMEYVDVNEACGRISGIPSKVMMEKGLAWVTRELGWSSFEQLPATYARLIANYPASEVHVREISRPGRPTVFLEMTRRAVRVEGKWLITSIGRDVTASRAEQHRLEQLSAAVNEAADAIVMIDPERMEYVDVNEAAGRMYELTRQELLDRGLDWMVQHIGRRTFEEMRAYCREIVASHPSPLIEVYPVRWPGRSIMVESTRRAVRIDGKWLIVGISRDVTERLRVMQELERRAQDLARSNSDLEQFAYVASHDLSEPLRMVASYTELIARRYSKLLDDDGREFMGFIVSGAQRMRQLIDDLLTYSRSGRPDPQAMAPRSLDGPLDAAVKNLEHVIGRTGARIERPAPLPQVACDKTGMTQLFQNLIGNALKFKGTEPPVVRISAQRQGQGWTISVADNGIGIAPAYFERIFVIFQRLHDRTSYEGTGIGLAICKKIVERHRGRLWVESEAGHGTTFLFHLPDPQEIDLQGSTLALRPPSSPAPSSLPK